MGNAGRFHYASAIALSLGLISPATAKAKPPKEIVAPRPITPAEREAVKAAIKDKMLDPSSVQFKWLPSVHEGRIYCAKFNGKNSFGGYVGFLPFLAYIDTSPAGPPTISRVLMGERGRWGYVRMLDIVLECERAGVELEASAEFEG